ncbi:uncharacterized protein BKA55DRAFT_145466 [Fusarium redolens]|uniref:Uncharacterized protein n=1 Tax=Fusarium redolens TaxID=48865 RepID=A0A9P9G871_FUSRE|nr:uncharacterized protein BKA55DRAFT_145466 [Fusarium redolens]KAH7233993.1 hypothetical protein BKA55DRAFT_145466 [Fusarium redolens]
MEEDTLPFDGPVGCVEKGTLNGVPHPKQLPTHEHTGHDHIIRWNEESSNLREIVPDKSGPLQVEWARLGYKLQRSKSEVREKFALLSVHLAVYLGQYVNVNGENVPQVLKDGWENYLEKKSLATAKVVGNPDEERREVSLVYGLLEFADHLTHALYDKCDLEKTVNDNSLQVLVRVLRCVFTPKDEGESEESNRMQILESLGTPKLSKWCADITIFLSPGRRRSSGALDLSSGQLKP